MEGYADRSGCQAGSIPSRRPFLAPIGPVGSGHPCLLIKVKQTQCGYAASSQIDPKRPVPGSTTKRAMTRRSQGGSLHFTEWRFAAPHFGGIADPPFQFAGRISKMSTRTAELDLL